MRYSGRGAFIGRSGGQGPTGKSFAMLLQLRRAGVEIELAPETYPNGRFASLSDPESAPIDLWEPTWGGLREPPG